MGFLAVVNAYTMRVVLSVAITEMVQSINHNQTIDSTTCPYEIQGNSTTSRTSGVSWKYILLTNITIKEIEF